MSTCNNNINGQCSCPQCNPCQDCNNIVPQQTCVTTCTCTTGQFSEDCPCGIIGTNCAVYTGDTLQDCSGNDYLFRGVALNTFLSNFWNTVKCAVNPNTDTTHYTGANILDCGSSVLVPTGATLTTTINNIWNNIKCWYRDLDAKINNKQPLWVGGYPILVGPSQTAPFNDLTSAIQALSYYHFNNTDSLTIELEDATHNVTTSNWHTPVSLDRYLHIKSHLGNAANVIINQTTNGQYTAGVGAGKVFFESVTIKNSGTGGCIGAWDGGFIYGTNVTLLNTTNATTGPLLASIGQVYLVNSQITNNSTNPVTIVVATNQANVTLANTPITNSGSQNSTAFLSQVQSKITLPFNKPGYNIVSNVNIVFNAYLDSSITCYPYHSVTFDNIGYSLIDCISNSNVILRTETSVGGVLPVTVNGRSLTGGGSGSSIVNVYNNSNIVTTLITANTFNRAAYIVANSKANSTFTITNVNNGIILDRNCSMMVNGSVVTNGNNGLIIANNSDVVTDDLQITGQAGGLNKVFMINASRLSRNNAVSNIGLDVAYSGIGNIVTG
jgi:hypothetical protein